MSDEEKMIGDRMREAQVVRLGGGVVEVLLEGITLREALLRGDPGRGAVRRMEHRDTSGYDAVLRSHCRM